ncbi:MAG: hypothetical protein IPF58_04925 [Saprospirales bacterium]|nr:hypothetical protein [Saprospirales bacterium]
MVDNGADGVFTCGTGDFTLNTYYPREGGVLPCSAEPIATAVMSSGWTGRYKIDLAANFCGLVAPNGATVAQAPFGYQKLFGGNL